MKHIRRASLFIVAAIVFSSLSSNSAHAAVARPVISIMSPTIKTRAVSENFTVTGKASGGNGVTNVFYALTNSATTNLGWLPANSTNGWTNWSAQVTLAPGTNVISAYAVDSRGTNSLTNTVRFIYVVLATLTVHTNGNVTVSPDYNGKELQIGTTYTMSGKSAVKGFGALNWTDASNNVVQTGNTLRFTMASNLVFTANYGDVLIPTLKFISAYTNPVDGVMRFFLRGTAADNVGVAGVFFKLNENPWQPVQLTTNQWTNWVARLDDLQPGLNSFSAYAVDTSSNRSFSYPLQILYPTSPAKLSGLVARVVPGSGTPFELSFGAKTFSHIPDDSAEPDALGTYAYAYYYENASLKVKYVLPPAATNLGSRTYNLYFSSPTTASYTYTNIIATNYPVLMTNASVITTNLISTNVVLLYYGSMYFSAAPKLAFASAVNQLVLAVSDDGEGNGTFFQSGKYTSFPLLTAGTNTGSYTYTAYSPVAGLFKLTRAAGTEFIVARFEQTNYGAYFFQDLNTSNQPDGRGRGRFIVGYQQPGGNAPASLVNRAFKIYSGGESFNDIFGTNTYSQDAATTNFDTAVGDYTYNLAGTNTARLNLSVTVPPQLAGGTNAARLIFVAPNAGLFTNEDGTISSFVMSTFTNLVMTSVENRTFSLRDRNDLFGFNINQLQPTNGGQFLFNGTLRGNYEYTIYSPAAAVFKLNFTTNTASPGVDWLQLKFTGTNSGSYYVNSFSETNTFQEASQGTFQAN